MSYALVSRSGNASAFEDMVSRCAAAGVDVYVDAVLNHMAAGSGVGVAGTTFGGRAYLNYTADEFHHDAGSESSNCVVSDYTSLDNVQKCDLEGLPDLCTECGSVQDTLGAYLRKLRDLGVRGFRLDAAKHQQSDALGRVLQQVRTPTPPYIYQEVIEGAGEAVTPEMYTGLGRVTEFRYASTRSGRTLWPTASFSTCGRSTRAGVCCRRTPPSSSSTITTRSAATRRWSRSATARSTFWRPPSCSRGRTVRRA